MTKSALVGCNKLIIHVSVAVPNVFKGYNCELLRKSIKSIVNLINKATKCIIYLLDDTTSTSKVTFSFLLRTLCYTYFWQLALGLWQ